jgi:hypothetical protein
MMQTSLHLLDLLSLTLKEVQDYVTQNRVRISSAIENLPFWNISTQKLRASASFSCSVIFGIVLVEDEDVLDIIIKFYCFMTR